MRNMSYKQHESPQKKKSEPRSSFISILREDEAMSLRFLNFQNISFSVFFHLTAGFLKMNSNVSYGTAEVIAADAIFGLLI